MGWLEFVAASEWPIVVGGGLLYFRRSIVGVLQSLRLKKAKAFGGEFEFETALETAVALADPSVSPPPELPAPPSTSSAGSTKSQNPTIALDAEPATQPLQVPAKRPSALVLNGLPSLGQSGTPRLRIMRSWGRLEMALRKAIILRFGKHATSQFRQSVETFAAVLGLNDLDLEALRNLKVVFNHAAHDLERELSDAEVSQFENVAEILIQKVVRFLDEVMPVAGDKALADLDASHPGAL